MAKYTAKLKKANYIPALIIIFCVAVFGAGIWSSGARSNPQQEVLPQTRNETQSFQLVGMGKAGRLLELRLKNISQKAITAYTISYSNGWKTDIDTILGDFLIAPGEVEEFQTPLSNLSGPDGSSLEQQIITILAVIFDDRSSEGDFEAIRDILNKRRGQKIQLKRINRLINTAMKSADENPSATISRLKDQISLLPDNQKEGQPFFAYLGLRYMKQQVLKQLEEFEQRQKSIGNDLMIQSEIHGSSVQDALNKLKELNEKRIAKL